MKKYLVLENGNVYEGEGLWCRRKRNIWISIYDFHDGIH